MQRDTLTVDQQRTKKTRNLIAGVGLELKLREILRNPTPTGLVEFQQLVQFAPATMKSKLLELV